MLGQTSLNVTIQAFKNSPWVLLDLLSISVGLIGMQSFLSWGSTYTIMSHANLFSSLCGIIIVVARLLTFQKVTQVEIVGAFVSVIGCILTTFDNKARKIDDSDQNIMLGNSLAALSSVFATVYLIRGAELSKKLPHIQNLILMTFMTNLIFFCAGPFVFPGNFTFTMDLSTGVFGWIADKNFLYSFFVLSAINGCGTLGLQLLAMKYFSPVIVGTMMLLEPVFSQIYGIALGLDEYPGILTYVGGIIVLAGLYQLLAFSEGDAPRKIEEQLSTASSSLDLNSNGYRKLPDVESQDITAVK